MAEPFLWGVVIMFILFILTFTVGDYIASYFNTSTAAFLGLNESVAVWPNALWFIIMPAMATLGIIYGFLEELRIFRRAPNQSLIYTIIGISWSGLLMYSGVLKILAVFFYQLGALMAAIVFSVVFIVGVIMWGAFRGKGMYAEFREEYGPLRGERGPAEREFVILRGNMKKLEHYAGLKTPTNDELTIYSNTDSACANALNRLGVELFSGLKDSEKKELDVLQKKYEKFKFKSPAT